MQRKQPSEQSQNSVQVGSVFRVATAVAMLIVATVVPVAARAQTFPADTAWKPFECGKRAMSDAYNDHGGAMNERDVVGVAASPAASRASDNEFLYLQLRVAATPVQGNGLRASVWGFAFSTDSDARTYEVLATLDGANGNVQVFRNSTTTLANRPEDPADLPAVSSYAFSTHGRTREADSMLGAGRDHLVEFALPWADLATVGITRDKNLTVWAASSTMADRLNGDFACHDGRGVATIPRLEDADSDAQRADGAGGTTGPGAGTGGTGADGAGGVTIEGGPACSLATSGRVSLFPALVVGAALLFSARRRSNRRKPERQ